MEGDAANAPARAREVDAANAGRQPLGIGRPAGVNTVALVVLAERADLIFRELRKPIGNPVPAGLALDIDVLVRK